MLLLVEAGWQDGYRIYGTLLHIDIIDHKLWIQHDRTEEGVAVDLVAAGIPKEQIVLVFEPLNNENIQSLQSRDRFGAIAFTSIKPVIAIHTHKKAIASLIFPHED